MALYSKLGGVEVNFQISAKIPLIIFSINTFVNDKNVIT